MCGASCDCAMLFSKVFVGTSFLQTLKIVATSKLLQCAWVVCNLQCQRPIPMDSDNDFDH